MHKRWLSLTLVLATAFTFVPGVAQARDWFVRSGATDGDGTQGKPFNDPWQALEKIEAGDRIDVAEGKYYGKLDCGTWKINYKVEMLGGYDKDFKERDPWKHPTELLWKKDSKNMSDTFRVLAESRSGSDPSGTVIDGFVFDMTDANFYVDAQKTGLDPAKARVRGAIGFMVAPVIARNNVIVNAEQYGMRVAPGSVIENNLIINSGDSAIWYSQGAPTAEKKSTTIRNNTIVFAWSEKTFGTGGPAGHGIKAQDYGVISGNILMYVDNQAIYFPSSDATFFKKSTVKDNVFWNNLFADVRLIVDGNDTVIDKDGMDLLEEVGFKDQGGNVNIDPKFDIDAKWMDRYSRRSASTRGKVAMDEWNQARKAAGLPLIASGGEPASGYMPAYDASKVAAFLTPKNAEVKAGARAKKLEVPAFATPAAAVARDYQKTDIVAVRQNIAGNNGQYVEMVVALSGTFNPDSFTAGAVKRDTHDAATIADPNGQSGSMALAVRKGTTAARGLADGFNGPTYNGIGKATRLFLVKGQVFAIASTMKVGIVADSFEPYEAMVAATARPQGRDWFVRADASGGNGSREKPFKDPWQALEKAELGDTVHVAGGEYGGKLKSGLWKVTTKYLTLMGGYNKDFTARDPWTNPTVLAWPADAKTQPLGYTIEGEGDVTGLTVDGFVFDKKLRNGYQSNGDMEFSRSDTRYSVFIPSPEGAVRNCVFVNHALSPIKLAEPFTLENNIVMNTVNAIMDISPNTATPSVIRNNTFLFSWDKRFGDGKSATGFALTVRKGPVVIDGNIFMFMDVNALKIYADPKSVTLTNNVFNKNLWSNVLVNDSQVIDDKTFGQLGDVGFKASGGNVVANPNFELDPAWMNVYMNRTAYVPGKVTMDDWNQLRSMLGQPLMAAGGKAADGFAPAYDWKKAIKLFPRNKAVTAGARILKLEAKFAGIARPDPTEGKAYAEVSFEELRDNWAKYQGKTLAIKVAIDAFDENCSFPAGYAKDTWRALGFYGTEGKKGALVRAMVKKSSLVERAASGAPALKEWVKPEALYTLKVTVLEKGYVAVDAIEKVEE
ncbi:MAG: right-handed parallel beta-helix repeat-containing protein [Spirochaetes bacterium]|nr:right-handed parallel beta-helix repeat-containing protein [Spirochaetota bacterium]